MAAVGFLSRDLHDPLSCVLRWHCTKSSDGQVRVLGAPSNLYDEPSHHERTLLPRSYISLLNVTQAVIGAYM